MGANGETKTARFKEAPNDAVCRIPGWDFLRLSFTKAISSLQTKRRRSSAKILRPIGSQSVSQRPRTINSDSRRGGGRGQMSSHNNSSPAVNDPRQPSTANPYVAPMVRPEDLPVDYSGFIAVIFAIVGLMFRYKLCSWLAIIFCAQSLSNMRNFENDLKQISMAMMFAIMGLMTNYLGLGPTRPSTQG